MRRVVAAPLLGQYLIWALLGWASAARAEVYVVVVAGLGGEPAYAEAFAAQAEAAADHARRTGAAVTLLVGDAARREAIRDALADIARLADAEDLAIIQLIGHGSWDDENYRFNVPGPDPSAADLAAWLAALASQQVLILATSASGAAVDALLKDDATVLAATRDGRERNAVLFGDYWTKALADAAADVDKDRRISADEAFDYTAAAVAEHYRRNGRIATEHPKRTGPPANATVALLDSGEDRRPRDPALASLAERSDALRQAVERLRGQKATLHEDDYFARLQELLLELARVERQLQGERETEE